MFGQSGQDPLWEALNPRYWGMPLHQEALNPSYGEMPLYQEAPNPSYGEMPLHREVLNLSYGGMPLHQEVPVYREVLPSITATPWGTRPPSPTATSWGTRPPSPTATPWGTRPPSPTATPWGTRPPSPIATLCGSALPSPTATPLGTRPPSPIATPSETRPPSPTYSHYTFAGQTIDGHRHIPANDVRNQVNDAPPYSPTNPGYPSPFSNYERLAIPFPPDSYNRRRHYLHTPIIPGQETHYTPSDGSPGPFRAIYNDRNRAQHALAFHDPSRTTSARGFNHFSLGTYHPSR